MAITDVYRIKAQIAVLKEVALDYSGKTINYELIPQANGNFSTIQSNKNEVF